METTKKMCPHCGEEVERHQMSCPKCSTLLISPSTDQYVNALYPPPYAKKTEVTPPKEEEEEEKKRSLDLKGSMGYLILSLGGLLLLIAFFLLFFSEKGLLVLEWKSRYWFFYILLGGPLSFWGWRLLKRSEETG